MNEDELTAEYIQSLAEKIERIKSLILSGSFEEISSIGHRLAGSGGSFGFPEISQLGAAIEKAGKEQDSVTLQKLIPSLQLEIKNIQEKP